MSIINVVFVAKFPQIERYARIVHSCIMITAIWLSITSWLWPMSLFSKPYP